MIAAGASAQQAPEIPRFSMIKAGGAPQDWAPVRLASFKRNTEYTVVTEDGVMVLRAVAHGAASGLMFKTQFDPHQFPMLSFRWKVTQGIPDADNADPTKEDSPVRILLEFDGDKSKLSIGERSQIATGKILSGRELPYATLMYIWSNKEPVGKVIANPRTRRVQMVVASSGASGVGAWQKLSRNAVEDFRRAFGEDPGKMIGVAVLTDTDNTGENVEAWYGDIVFRAAAR
jgi:hypothetical protein